MAKPPPRVFISYSHDSPEHADRVLAFADALRASGVDAVIDQYEPNPPDGWPHWMQEQLEAAQFVLLVCTPIYHERVIRKQAPGIGRGVMWEANLIYNRLYENPNLGNIFTPILLDGAGKPEDIPEPLRGYTQYRVAAFSLADPQYERLYRHLTRQPAATAGPLGEIQSLPPKARAAGFSALPANAIWNVPYPRNPFFTGRDDVLARLRTNLLSGKPAALTQAQAISGLGGIGKTQTAVEYAYRHRGDYAAVLWLSAASAEALTSGFADLARLLELPEAAARDQAVTTAAVQRWLRENADWLLILDNADDIALARAALPGGLRGHVIITTRATALGGIAEPLRITKLSPEDGAEFLLRRGRVLGPEPTPARPSPPLPKREGKETEGSDRVAALAIAKELDGLPLALDQAGAYIEETPATPPTYLKLLRARRGGLLAQRGGLGEADHASVTVTYSLAFEKVERVNPASADLLRLCAFLSPDAIPEEILTKGAKQLGRKLGTAVRDDLARAAAIRDARKWSLLDCDPAAKTLGLHRLVQAVVRETMNTAAQRAWAERAVLALNAAFPNPSKFENWPSCDRLAPHAQAVLEWIDLYKVETSEASRLLNQAGYYLDDRAQYAAAEPLYQRAISIGEKVYGPDHPEVATSLNNLAALYKNQGNFAAAEPLYQRALAIDEKALGPDHPSTATGLNNLAELYRAQGNYAAAEPLYQRALAIKEKALGPDHPSTATGLNNLALLYVNQGNYAAAEPLYQRALAIRESALGPDHPLTATSLNNLAGLYDNQGSYAAAEPLYQRALAIDEKALGPDHPDTATSLNNLAGLYDNQGSYAAAEPLYQRALAIDEKALGPDHPDTATSLNNLAGLYYNQGNYAAAEPLYQRALAIREKALGPDHPLTINCRRNYEIFLEEKNKR